MCVCVCVREREREGAELCVPFGCALQTYVMVVVGTYIALPAVGCDRTHIEPNASLGFKKHHRLSGRV